MLLISDWYILPAAFLLDFLLGDPLWLPHPVRWMGKGIEKLEPRFREKIRNTKFAGVCFALMLIIATWILCALTLILATTIHPSLGKLFEIIIIYYAISTFSLKKAAMDVYYALTEQGLDAAKRKLAHIVGRDVEPLDREGVLRASIETVAENLVDGVISPLFWAGVGGAPLAMAFKMINTLDSMVGYKSDEYIDFGKASAKIDDFANYIPARLSLPVISFSAYLLKLPWKRVLETGLSDGRNHTSPNAGYPEAAFAGALGVRLGGPSLYEGILVDKPYIGGSFDPPDDKDLKEACQLLVISSVVSIVMSMTLAHVVSFL
ncbi:MAG: adenosylcobinamide-phosphate synthase CbiB [Desulfobacteraceae bacterium]|jgi:adenosylcobinamide-phosphate synthase